MIPAVTSPGEANNGFDDELDNSNWPSGTFTNISLGSGGGTYSVVIKDNADGDADTSADVDKNVVLTSTGTINGVTATVEAYIYRPQFKSKFALLSEGDIDINGNSTTIAGSNGAVHSNGDVTQTGGPTVEEGASATGSCGGSDCSSGASEEFVPVIEPSDYEQYADYIVNDDGTIDQNVSGTITTGVEGNAIFPITPRAGQWEIVRPSAQMFRIRHFFILKTILKPHRLVVQAHRGKLPWLLRKVSPGPEAQTLPTGMRILITHPTYKIYFWLREMVSRSAA